MRLVIIAILAYILYLIIKWFLGSGKKINLGSNGGVIDEMVQDPFCKTYIPRRDSLKRVIEGKEYFFCCDECASKYKSERKS